MTPAELDAALTAWQASVNWRLIDRDAAYGAQCWDLVADFAERVVGCPTTDFWTLYDESSPDHTLVSSMWLYWPVKPGVTAYFARLDRHATIQRGDVLIWARSRPYPDSHIAVSLAAAANGAVLCMTQNPGAARAEHLTLDGLLGILRPITTTPHPPIPEDDSMDTLYTRPTSNSTPIDGPTSARVWSGDEREFDGTKYSGTWAIDASTGTARRLTMAEWLIVQKAYAARGIPIPLAEVNGNAVEVLLHGPKGKR